MVYAYDGNAAVNFAQTHMASNHQDKAFKNCPNSWLCADFVSNCLKAGGLSDANYSTVGNLYNYCKSHGTSYVLDKGVKSGNDYPIKSSGNGNNLTAGDVVIAYCPTCNIYLHSELISKSSGGYFYGYSHNANRINRQIYFSQCTKGHAPTIYGVHLTGGTPQQPSVAHYTVTFNKNGWTTSGATSVTVYKNANTFWDVSYLNPIQANFEFLGWYDFDDNIVYNAQGHAVDGKYWKNNNWIYDGNVTVYAKGKRTSSYTVTFDKNGWTTSGATSVTVYKNANTFWDVSYLNPIQANFEFLGWYDFDDNIVYNAQGHAVDGKYWKNNNWIYDGNVTVYAKGKRTSSYTVTFDKNGWTTSGATSVTVYKNANTFWDVSYLKPIQANFEFLGWYDIDDNIVYDVQGHAVDGKYWKNNNWIYDGNVTVYAKGKLIVTPSDKPVTENTKDDDVSENKEPSKDKESSTNNAIVLSKTNVTIKNGKSFTIKIVNMPKGDAVKLWKSSNTKVATVSKNGKIKAKKKGSCTITLTLKSGKKVKIKIKVKK